MEDGHDPNQSVKERYIKMKEVSFSFDLEQEIMVTEENGDFCELLDSIMEKLCCKPWFTIVKMKKKFVVNVLEALEAVKSELDGLLLIFKMLTQDKAELITDNEMEMATIYNDNDVIYMEIIMMNDGTDKKDEENEGNVKEEALIKDERPIEPIEEEYKPQIAHQVKEKPRRHQNKRKYEDLPVKQQDNQETLQYRPRIRDLMENQELKQQIALQDRRPKKTTNNNSRKDSGPRPYEGNSKNDRDDSTHEHQYHNPYNIHKPHLEHNMGEDQEGVYKKPINYAKNNIKEVQAHPKLSNPSHNPYSHYASYKNATNNVMNNNNYHTMQNNAEEPYRPNYGQNDQHSQSRKFSDSARHEKQPRQRIMKN